MDLWTNGSLQFDRSTESIIDGNHDHRISKRMGFIGGKRNVRRDFDTFHFEIAFAPYSNQVIANLYRYAVTDFELSICNGRKSDVSLLCLVKNRHCNGMMKFLFCSCSEFKNAIFVPRTTGVNLSNFRTLSGKCPCFIEENRVNFIH